VWLARALSHSAAIRDNTVKMSIRKKSEFFQGYGLLSTIAINEDHQEIIEAKGTDYKS
jgi:hypothetical protein